MHDDSSPGSESDSEINSTIDLLDTEVRELYDVGTPGLGYPLLLCLGKSLVVILNYALIAEQPDPCGPEPYSPGKRPGPAPRLGKVRWHHVSRRR